MILHETAPTGARETDRSGGAAASPAAPVITARRRRPSSPPSLRVERSLHREGFAVLAGMDEVGRGALAGPVTVGVVCVDQRAKTAPRGVRDSKLLTPDRRQALIVPIQRWALAWGVGHASPAEIDEVGVIAALRLAGRRALAAAGIRPDLVLLDGCHDWLSDPAAQGLLGLLADAPTAPPVRTRVKADLTCSSVAAASVLAKVERDELMRGLSFDHPVYGWEVNKGYAAPEHLAALAAHGPCVLHRRSWRLPGPITETAATEETCERAVRAMVHDGPDEEVGRDGR